MTVYGNRVKSNCRVTKTDNQYSTFILMRLETDPRGVGGVHRVDQHSGQRLRFVSFFNRKLNKMTAISTKCNGKRPNSLSVYWKGIERS